MNTLFDYRVIEDPTMLMDGEPIKVHRTWKERLFSLPWRPHKSTRFIINKVPSMEVIQLDNTLVMHPALLKIMREHI